MHLSIRVKVGNGESVLLEMSVCNKHCVLKGESGKRGDASCLSKAVWKTSLCHRADGIDYGGTVRSWGMLRVCLKLAGVDLQ